MRKIHEVLRLRLEQGMSIWDVSAASEMSRQAAARWATLGFDAADNVLVKNYQGVLAMTLTFDAANRIVSMVQGSATTNYTYNAVGNLTLEAQGASQTGYVYDGENRLTQLTQPVGSIITNTYAGHGLRRTTQQPSSTVSTIVWDGTDYLAQS
jgi:YD repeat-containing protein